MTGTVRSPFTALVSSMAGKVMTMGEGGAAVVSGSDPLGTRISSDSTGASEGGSGERPCAWMESMMSTTEVSEPSGAQASRLGRSTSATLLVAPPTATSVGSLPEKGAAGAAMVFPASTAAAALVLYVGSKDSRQVDISKPASFRTVGFWPGNELRFPSADISDCDARAVTSTDRWSTASCRRPSTATEDSALSTSSPTSSYHRRLELAWTRRFADTKPRLFDS
mmetsp:Transcript_3509/g.10173  ORF Transcript_3509/g.10173 Transcript_3509/m.10173 type:complete len:224 (+) Transcript_3509:513-1184(+)